MGLRPSNSVVQDLRTLFDLGGTAPETDGHLLDQFRCGEGAAAEAAFTALVGRHGPMVLRVCRNVLNDEHDAQDAFQATFLVLVRKAQTVRNRSSVASWLHGVAHRVALKAREDAARRKSHERRVAAMVKESQGDDLGRLDLGLLADPLALDEEIRGLPEKHRAAIVLCYLEGLSQDQAAVLLGWPSGTLRGRLSRAREQLRTRLMRRGVAFSAGAIAAGETARGASAAVVPPALLNATTRSALLAASGKAGTGAASATVAALVDGTVRVLTYATWFKVAAIACGIGIVGTSAAKVAQNLPTHANQERDRRDNGERPTRLLKSIPEASTFANATVQAPTSIPSPPPVDQDREPTAFAAPMNRIVLDGKLDDWPKGMTRYPITQSNGQGGRNQAIAFDKLGSEQTAYFNVGYNPDDQRIYLAVVVRDEIPVVGHTDPWCTDAVEVFLDGPRTMRHVPLVLGKDGFFDLQAATMPAMQYGGIPDLGSVYGYKGENDNPALFYGDIHKTRTAMAWTRADGVITYEWAIQAFDRYPDEPTKLEPGTRIGFDVAVLDQNLPDLQPRRTPPDDDLLPSYTCWAPCGGGFKGANAELLGDLIFTGPR
ncbi:sigma-70 family RNA polymerase sigma factor [Singulisphaera sp. PoT]|uniref:sigma-70 family RNA polymerase sigma factor n=1 Tax=Singulisphaera sp. PoT TaxID=3411797 RepID=UPI003BF5673C